MYLLLDSSTSVCKLSLVVDSETTSYEWDSGRELARKLLAYIVDRLAENHRTWADIKGIGVFVGPGSFTGLRIGMTVLNTIADAQEVPIVGGEGEDWATLAISKLKNGIDEKIILPKYGQEPRITEQKK
jgi:tRNA threonylcarbamoyladenosine biosynthesis protein TsaB